MGTLRKSLRYRIKDKSQTKPECLLTVKKTTSTKYWKTGEKEANYTLYVNAPTKHVTGMVRISNCTQSPYVLNMKTKNADL